MENSRFGIYKNGYITEIGDEIEPKFLGFEKSEVDAIKLAKQKCWVSDHFIVKEFFDGLYWVSIENSEKEVYE